jgi:GT2 family glycosyltransferase
MARGRGSRSVASRRSVLPGDGHLPLPAKSEGAAISRRAAGPVSAGLRLDADGVLFGWAIDLSDPARRLVVEIVGDGVSLAVVKADMHVDWLQRNGHGDGCYGFTVASNPRLLVANFELVLANDDRVIARCAARSDSATDELAAFSTGSVLWRGGLRLSGTLRDHRASGATLPELHAYDGSKQLDVVLRLHPEEADLRGGACYQFDLLLPAELADGELHMVRVVNEAGAQLDGSPVAVLAHRHGFRGLAPSLGRLPKAAETLRQQTLAFLEQLIPASLPFERYSWWSKAFADEAAFADVASNHTIGIVIVGKVGSEVTLASLRQQRGQFSVRVGILDVDESDHFRFSRAQWETVRADLAATGAVATLILRAGASLKPFACLALADGFDLANAAENRAALCLADHELFDLQGGNVPLFLPTFDYERLLSQGYAEGFFAIDRLPAMEGAPDDLLSTYDVLLSALEDVRSRRGKVVHVPRMLASVPRLTPEAASNYLASAVRAHFDRRGEQADIEPGQGAALPVVHVRRPRPDGEVSIIIPTRDRLDLLKPCIDSIRDLTSHSDYRILIVDNGSRDQGTLDYLRDLTRQGVTVLRDDGVFNYSRLNNAAIRDVRSPFVCLLNNDVEVLAPDWLSDMQGFFARERVGGVGAKLIWPNGMLQHGGVVLGMNFAAGHAYDRYLADEPGYADGILVAREAGALTAACLLMKREDVLHVGGLDEIAFPVAFNDVDLCLKLRDAGKVLVWSPRARLLHRESASRTSDHESPAKQSRFEKELAELRRRWAVQFLNDAYYNPSLNLDAYGYTGLSLPPRSRARRVAIL